MPKIIKKYNTVCECCECIFSYKQLVWDKYKFKKEYTLQCPNCYNKKFKSVRSYKFK